MKSLFIKLFVVFTLTINVSAVSLAKELEAFYNVGIGAINIGSLKWIINLEDNNYETSVFLKNKGVVSSIYKFSGEYFSEGSVFNGEFVPSKYKQFWKTKKKTREVEIIFEKAMVSNLILNPKEKEMPRIDYLKVSGLIDPLSSFLNILTNKSNDFKTIDGRRLYKMSSDFISIGENIISIKIFITNYLNIWADHKRKDLKYIVITQDLSKEGNIFPTNIKIKNKGLVFRLTKI